MAKLLMTVEFEWEATQSCRDEVIHQARIGRYNAVIFEAADGLDMFLHEPECDYSVAWAKMNVPVAEAKKLLQRAVVMHSKDGSLPYRLIEAMRGAA